MEEKKPGKIPGGGESFDRIPGEEKKTMENSRGNVFMEFQGYTVSENSILM